MEPSLSPTLRVALDRAAHVLRASSPTPAIDAEVLLRHATGLARADIIARPEYVLADSAHAAFASLIERRRYGEPVAYLIGRREFWSLDLLVSPATLIPRPETELLVERALARAPADSAPSIADLGTGCGAVALAIAHERPDAHVVATDCSETALAVARANASRLQFAKIEFCLGDWLLPLQGRRFDVIASNPPYVRAGDPHLAEGDLRFEPHTALVAGADGFAALRKIADTAAAHLHAGGWLVLEHGSDQAAAVHAQLAASGYRHIHTYKDLAGRSRVTEGQAY